MNADANSLPVVCFVCTGNAARSVMARAILAERTQRYRVIGAGTFALEGHPMSQRTRLALNRLGISDRDHRSRQFGTEHAEADLVITMEPDHVKWVRKHYPQVSSKTGTLRRLVRDMPTKGNLKERVTSLNLADVILEDWEKVVDPASGDQDVFDACAMALDDLVGRLALRLF